MITLSTQLDRATCRDVDLPSPDLAPCHACLRDVLDPHSRRFHYPFATCPDCGPRFSILHAMPFRLQNTSMRCFQRCAACQAEHDDPVDRRFSHPLTFCPRCGPQVESSNTLGRVLARGDNAISAAAASIRKGEIIAVMGICGFHLVVAAGNLVAVEALRRRIGSPDIPLPIMIPTTDLLHGICHCNPGEDALLRSPAAPLVLLRLRDYPAGGPPILPAVSAGHPVLPVMRPFSMLHLLLMQQLGFAIVAVPAGRFGGPGPTSADEALVQLAGIADGFLTHNLPIVRPMDDAFMRIVADRPMLLRSGRGTAPIALDLPGRSPPVLGLGGHLKNTVTLTMDGRAVVSQHIGDLETAGAMDAFDDTVETFSRLLSPTEIGQQPERSGRQPRIVACDLHPDYLSSQRARQIVTSPVEVQHHHAHIAACMAEHGCDGEVLGICWDGTGFGTDGTIWGGEFLIATRRSFRRLAHLRTFPLPGAARAVREPRRSALGLLYEVFGEEVRELRELAPIRAFAIPELETLLRMIRRGVNSPRTSSMGRLFDAVAALLDVRQAAAYEGQAAMELEHLADGPAIAAPYPFAVADVSAPWAIDWAPMIRTIVVEVREAADRRIIAARFHRSLVEVLRMIARRAGMRRVVLSGGCFQNVLLLESAIESLRNEGFEPYWPQRVPPNDNGLSLGQAVVAGARALRED